MLMRLDGIIYDRWSCAEEVIKSAFPNAVCASSSHIGGIRISAICKEYPDWFVGLNLAVDSNLSVDGKRHSRFVYVEDTSIDITKIREKFTELRKFLKEPYQEVDLIWEVRIAAYW